MPALASDLMAEVGGAQPRDWNPVPSVGFCGYVGSAWSRLLYLATGRTNKRLGLVLRARATRALAASRDVESKLILRPVFLGGADSGRFSDSRRFAAARQEFLDNVFGTDYTLCLRGAGNYSFRFYEVLSAGRIPLFVNTRCVLPCEDEIDWHKHCCWVEEADLQNLPQRLRAFHERLGPDGFMELQSANRHLWERWLSPRGFHEHAFDRAVSSGASSR